MKKRHYVRYTLGKDRLESGESIVAYTARLIEIGQNANSTGISSTRDCTGN